MFRSYISLSVLRSWLHARRTSSLFFAVLAVILCSGTINAQDCNALVPGAGGQTDDAININNCLANSGFARLTANTSANPFKLYQPIIVHRASAQLTGAGNNIDKTFLQPQYSCGQSSLFVVGGVYQPTIMVTGSPDAVISNFMLDLSNLRKSCQIGADYAVRVGAANGGNASPRTQVTFLRIIGSQYNNNPFYTTGWSHGGGILVFNTDHAVVENNVIKDLGFTTALGGASAGAAGIQVANSNQSSVRNNNVNRVSFGIQVVNKSPSQGYSGDSSYTTVSGNSTTGAGNIGCPDCAAGRGYKFQACGLGDELPIRYMSVTNNTASTWGGPNQAAVVPSGLDLICGIQYGAFSGNIIDGSSDPTTSLGLEIRSKDPGLAPQSASHHNVFSANTFRASGCSGCFDVYFEATGPDQSSGTISATPSIGRHGNLGGNSYVTTGSGQDRGCGEFAHAWFQYPASQNYVNRGQTLIVAASGIRPDSTKPITFVFRNPSGNTVLIQTYYNGGGFVLNQQNIVISSGVFTVPGLYKVYASYYDGNSDTNILEDWIGTGGQQVALDVR